MAYLNRYAAFLSSGIEAAAWQTWSGSQNSRLVRSFWMCLNLGFCSDIFIILYHSSSTSKSIPNSNSKMSCFRKLTDRWIWESHKTLPCTAFGTGVPLHMFGASQWCAGHVLPMWMAFAALFQPPNSARVPWHESKRFQTWWGSRFVWKQWKASARSASLLP